VTFTVAFHFTEAMPVNWRVPALQDIWWPRHLTLVLINSNIVLIIYAHHWAWKTKWPVIKDWVTHQSLSFMKSATNSAGQWWETNSTCKPDVDYRHMITVYQLCEQISQQSKLYHMASFLLISYKVWSADFTCHDVGHQEGVISLSNYKILYTICLLTNSLTPKWFPSNFDSRSMILIKIIFVIYLYQYLKSSKGWQSFHLLCLVNVLEEASTLVSLQPMLP
jgi:hypothetical protein